MHFFDILQRITNFKEALRALKKKKEGEKRQLVQESKSSSDTSTSDSPRNKATDPSDVYVKRKTHKIRSASATYVSDAQSTPVEFVASAAQKDSIRKSQSESTSQVRKSLIPTRSASFGAHQRSIPVSTRLRAVQCVSKSTDVSQSDSPSSGSKIVRKVKRGSSFREDLLTRKPDSDLPARQEVPRSKSPTPDMGAYSPCITGKSQDTSKPRKVKLGSKASDLLAKLHLKWNSK